MNKQPRIHLGRGTDEIFDGVFLVSRYFGLFPFRIERGGLNLSPRLIPLSALCLGYVVFTFSSVQRVRLGSENSLELYLPELFLQAVVPTYFLMLVLKLKRFQKLFQGIEQTECTTGKAVSVSSTKTYLVMVSFVVADLFFVMAANADVLSILYDLYELYLTIVILLNVIAQFISLTSLIREHYRNLAKTVTRDNADEWVQCHDTLRDCCAILCECYSPQLFLLVVSSYLTVVYHTFYVATSEGLHQKPLILIEFVIWMVLNVTLIWYIVYCCKRVIEKAKKFDKLLYSLVINDSTGTLLENKRITLHFKTNHKVEFSALGFFNFDYPLLCSIISSATTYIVILVQFASNKPENAS